MGSTQATPAMGKVTVHPLHISQPPQKKRMPAKRGRIAHQLQLSPYTDHARVHAPDVRQEADLALGLLRDKVMAMSRALGPETNRRGPRWAYVAAAGHVAVKGSMRTTARAPTALAKR